MNHVELIEGKEKQLIPDLELIIQESREIENFDIVISETFLGSHNSPLIELKQILVGYSFDLGGLHYKWVYSNEITGPKKTERRYARDLARKLKDYLKTVGINLKITKTKDIWYNPKMELTGILT